MNKIFFYIERFLVSFDIEENLCDKSGRAEWEIKKCTKGTTDKHVTLLLRIEIYIHWCDGATKGNGKDKSKNHFLGLQHVCEKLL